MDMTTRGVSVEPGSLQTLSQHFDSVSTYDHLLWSLERIVINHRCNFILLRYFSHTFCPEEVLGKHCLCGNDHMTDILNLSKTSILGHRKRR